METKEALSIVLSLAIQNALDIDGPLDPPLEFEAQKQHTALNIISQLKDDVRGGFSLPDYGSIVRLPCYGISLYSKCGASRITSDLHEGNDTEEHTARLDSLESLILAHFSTGVNVASSDYVEGIETAVETIFNQ